MGLVETAELRKQEVADRRKVMVALRALRPTHSTKRRIELLSELSPERTAVILTLLIADGVVICHRGGVQGRTNTYLIVPGQNRRA